LACRKNSGSIYQLPQVALVLQLATNYVASREAKVGGPPTNETAAAHAEDESFSAATADQEGIGTVSEF